METQIRCQNCKTVNIVINNELFFSEQTQSTSIYCCNCNCILTEMPTDGWFFVQSSDQYEIDLSIDEQKKELKFENEALFKI